MTSPAQTATTEPIGVPIAKRLLTEYFADWAAAVVARDIPGSACHAARCAIFDTLGVMAAGSAHPKVTTLAESLAASPGVSTTATGHRMEATGAATVNGMAAHVWDFDDNSYTGMIHGSAIILSAVLAVADEISATDDDILLAFVIGSEIAYTLGEVVAHGHFLRGWWATGSLALIGAVAGVCRLYSMDANATAQAIGMAVVSAGIERAIAGTDTKPYLCGHVAARAIILARAARAGLTGPQDGFEHPNGFLALLNGGEGALAETKTLGHRWRLETPGLLFKTSPVCSAAHAVIDLTAELLSKAGKVASEIATARAEVPKLVRASLVFDRPTNAQEAQFSLPYCLANSALHGRVRLEDLTPEAITAPDRAAIMARVSVEIADDLSVPPLSADFPESARLTLTFTDGSTVSGFCGEAYGMPNHPLTEADLCAKFASCMVFAGRRAPAGLSSNCSLSLLARHAFGMSAQQ